MTMACPVSDSSSSSSRWASTSGVWVREVAPRLGIAGGVIGVILVKSTLPQVVRTSNGLVKGITPAMWIRMCLTIIPKAGGLKFVQYGVMREMKLTLDSQGCPPGASTMLSFGFVGTFFQSAIYNTLIKDVYRIYSGSSVDMAELKVKSPGISPGIVWCFGRECFSMGGGLYLGPLTKQALQKQLQEHNVEIPEYPLRFLAGFLSGACTAFGTQFMHNITLTAGRMAALGETRGAPFFTGRSLAATYKEMGMSMFYANYPHRMTLIAGAVALLNMVDIFHRKDIVLTRAF